MSVTRFEDKDRRPPLVRLARDGLLFVVLPTSAYAAIYLVFGGEVPLQVWMVSGAWILGGLVEGLRRYREIATADAISRIEVQVDQVSRCVLRVKLEASAFRRIKRVIVALVVTTESLDGSGKHPHELDRRDIPGLGRRFSTTSYLSLLRPESVVWCDMGLAYRVRLVLTVEGRADYVHDVPVHVVPNGRPSDQVDIPAHLGTQSEHLASVPETPGQGGREATAFVA